MTEWRIRLEGSGQSSGTPFEKRLLWSVPLLRFISFPHVEKPQSGGTRFLCCSAKFKSPFFFTHSYYLPGYFFKLLQLL